MVQDMYDPEFFLGAYTVHEGKTGVEYWKTGMFRDLIDCSVSCCFVASNEYIIIVYYLKIVNQQIIVYQEIIVFQHIMR